MQNAGWKLREVRERLHLTYRQVEEATRQLASAKLNSEYLVTISRLSEIENNNVLPSIFRFYSLSVVYRLGFLDMLEWYGVELCDSQQDARMFAGGTTQLIAENGDGRTEVSVPIRLDPSFDVRRTAYLSRIIQAWGTAPLAMLRQLETRKFRYGYIGSNDWTMYPLITPDSLVQIDPDRRKVETQGWRNEFERPIYFIETRNSYVCSWVMLLEPGQLLIQPYSFSPCRATVVAVPGEATIVGQVTGVAMHLAGARVETAHAIAVRR